MRYSLLLLFSLFLQACHSKASPPAPNEKLDPRTVLGDHSYSITVGQLQRTYSIYAPSSYDASRPLPVVIYIHGGGGDASAATADGLPAYADSLGFILAAPNGIEKQWNGGTWETGTCCGSVDDVGFIRQMIQQIKENYYTDEARFYATGISNGGLMTNRVGCELSTVVTAIATVAPAARPSNCAPSRKVPVLDIHGALDRCNPMYGGTPPFSFCANQPYQRMSMPQILDFWRSVNGCTTSSTSLYENGGAHCLAYKGCTAEVAYCQVDNMGHTYPSGAQYLSSSLIGPVSTDISFRQIWEFFSRHRL